MASTFLLHQEMRDKINWALSVFVYPAGLAFFGGFLKINDKLS